MTAVTIRKTHHKALPILKSVSFEDVLVTDLRYARKVWEKMGGPISPQAWLLSEPTASAKARKSVVPEYMLYLLPHLLAGHRNLCPWSTKGCRKNCLVSAGRGAQPNVYEGRRARTQLMFEEPAAFFALLLNDMRRIDNRGEAWIRLNGTSDIPWESVPVMVEMMEEYSHLQFADYTKASILDRPAPSQDNYRLARSVWVGKHTADDIADLLTAGERVSMVVANPKALDGLRFVVQADKTDEWLLQDGPSLGLLSPKGKLRRDPKNFYTNSIAEEAIRIAN